MLICSATGWKGDFFILANSTFSFWAQFFARCRRELAGWWTEAFPAVRAAHSVHVLVNPYRQDKIVEDGQRSSTFELINGPYLYPRAVPLFEADYGAAVADRGAAGRPGSITQGH